MSEQSPKDQKSKLPPGSETPGAESAELQAALARFAKVLDKAIVPAAKDVGDGTNKPTH